MRPHTHAAPVLNSNRPAGASNVTMAALPLHSLPPLLPPRSIPPPIRLHPPSNAVPVTLARRFSLLEGTKSRTLHSVNKQPSPNASDDTMASPPIKRPPPSPPPPPPLYTPVFSSTLSNIRDAHKRVAVSICGQLGRLELRSKIKNLVEVNRHNNVAVAMFLVLQERTFAYGGNGVGYRTSDDSHGKGEALYKMAFEKLPTLQCDVQVVRYLSPPGYCRGKFQAHCTNGQLILTAPPTCNILFRCGTPPREVQCNVTTSSNAGCICEPMVHQEALSNFPNRNCTGHTYSKEAALAELRRNNIHFSAHFPQHSRWKFLPEDVKRHLLRRPHVSKPKSINAALIEGVLNMRKSALMIEQYEIKHGFHFDDVIRIRDDSIVTTPFVYPFTRSRSGSFSNSSLAQPCFAKKCFSWHGVNDKVMLCPRAHMHALLRAFGEDMMFTKGEDLWEFWFSEKALEWTLARYDVPIVLMDADELPFVTGRLPCNCQARVTSPATLWCLASKDYSDCHPPSYMLDDDGSLFVARVPWPRANNVSSLIANRPKHISHRRTTYRKPAQFLDIPRIDGSCGSPPRVAFMAPIGSSSPRWQRRMNERCLLGTTYGCYAGELSLMWIAMNCFGIFNLSNHTVKCKAPSSFDTTRRRYNCSFSPGNISVHDTIERMEIAAVDEVDEDLNAWTGSTKEGSIGIDAQLGRTPQLEPEASNL